MRRLLFIGILMLLAFSACHTPTRKARRMVARAELLAETDPDSTIRLIDSVLRMPVSFSERRRMDLALLQGEVLFGHSELDDDFDFLDSTATSPELERAADYYAQKKQYAKAAHAALYNGYVQQHYNEKENAMRSYKDAEHYGGLVGDSLTVARAGYHIGLMLYSDIVNEALIVLKMTGLYFGNHFADKALSLNLMATCYILLDDYKNAEYQLQACLEYAEKGHSRTVKTKALNNYAVLFRQTGEYNKALYCLKQADSIARNEAKTTIYLNMAQVYMAQGKVDSASIYFQYVEDRLAATNDKTAAKASAYAALSQFAESHGNYSEAYRYRGLYDHLLFNLMAERERKSVYRIQQQYDYNVLRETMSKKVIHRQRIIMVLSILAALVLVAFSISQIRLARIRKQEADIKASLLNFMERNRELEQKSAEQEKSSNALLTEYKNAYGNCANKLSDAWLKEQRIMQKLAVYLHNEKDAALLGSLRQTVFGNLDYWEAMTKAFDKQFPGVRKNLMQHHDLSENELKILLLSYIDTSRDDTSLLLGISIYMVDKLRISVKKKMQGKV